MYTEAYVNQENHTFLVRQQAYIPPVFFVNFYKTRHIVIMYDYLALSNLKLDLYIHIHYSFIYVRYIENEI